MFHLYISFHNNCCIKRQGGNIPEHKKWSHNHMFCAKSPDFVVESVYWLVHELATFSEPKESVMKLIEDGSSDWDSQLHGGSGPNGIQGRVAQMAFLKQP